MRTHACGDLRAAHVGTEVTLCGWIWRERDHGGVTFLDLRDREGLVQLVFHPEENPQAHAAAEAFKPESVVGRRRGPRPSRGHGEPGPADRRGRGLRAVRRDAPASETPPFPIEDRIEASEELRLRSATWTCVAPRCRSSPPPARRERIVRDHMESLGFLEVETPYLTRSTPRAPATSSSPLGSLGAFYALPQSPQQLKQLLMVAGQDRYYQIVRCFRDENPRADRGFEFTQLTWRCPSSPRRMSSP
jgi:aspartyl-tRNA synthetase